MAVGPGGNSIFIPTGPAPDYTQFLENDPFYKQQITWIDDANRLATERAAAQSGFDQRAYDLNVAQANASANSGGDYGLGAAQANAALQKEGLAHENTNRAEYLREWLGSRGMHDSGQNAWEQNERGYQFDLANRGIDADLAARASAAAQARAEAQSRLQMQLQELALRKEQSALGDTWAAEDRALGAAKAKGEAAFDLYNRLLASGKLNAPGEMALWDEESGLYVTKDGRYFDAYGGATSYQRKQQQAATQQQTSGGGDPVGGGGYYADPGPEPYGYSRPLENVIPGSGWGYF